MAEHPWLKTVLTPFSAAYGWVTFVRNLLYDSQWFSSQKAPQTVISIGNLTVGGTGKTPVTEYLVRLLSSQYPLAILSRGYGRKTKGFLLADSSATAAQIGDEPMQFFSKFGASGIVVAVDEKRVSGATKIFGTNPEKQILLLDDAFQHRAIRRDINLLLNDFNRPFYKDLPFPAGRLRETRSGAKRADAVIVTKCPPERIEETRDAVTAQVSQYTQPGTPVFFSSTAYGSPTDYENRPVRLNNVKIVTGIADPRPFHTYVGAHFNVLDTVTFPDHYNYKAADVEALIKYLKNDTFVITTEKDMVKLKPLAAQLGYLSKFAYIPVSVDFGNDTQRFSDWLLGRIAELERAAE